MNPSRLFILRPVATSLLMVAILLAGIVAFQFLPLSALPEVDYPTIQVQTFYPGASPEVMTSSVTAPLERQFGQMPGLNADVVDQLRRRLGHHAAVRPRPRASTSPSRRCRRRSTPPATCCRSDLPAPPIYAKVNPADAPILTLALTSKTLPLTQVEDLADTRLAQKISQLAGRRPGQHQRRPAPGGAHPGQPAARSPPTASTSTICAPRSATPTSTRPRAASTGRRAPTRSTPTTSCRAPRDYRRHRHRLQERRAGAPERRRRRSSTAPRTPSSAAWVNTTPAIILNVQRQPGANVIARGRQHQAAAAAAAGVAAGRRSTSTVLTDRTTTIRASVADVEFELALAVALVVLVIFLFLRNLPATIIPSLSVPLSLVGTFAVMYLPGFSLNNLSLMALTIATGFVVDDAIVMIENISRYIEAGRDAAARRR